MKFIVKHKWLYYLLQFTWGIVMNTIGIIVFLILICCGKKVKRFHNNFYIVIGKNWGGVELGCFFLIDSSESKHTKYHESGHAIQNIIFGPLFPFIVAIPSAIRYWYRHFKYDKQGKRAPTAYDSIWFEGQATDFGYKYYTGSIIIDGN